MRKDTKILTVMIWLCTLAAGLTMIWMTQDDMAKAYDGRNAPTIEQIIDCRPPECLRVVVPEEYLDGSDGACVAAGMWMLRHFQRDPDLKSILLTNRGWVPSTYRLVDKRWAHCLADEFESQYCEELANPGWYDKDP